jgi:hypothetical protein
MTRPEEFPQQPDRRSRRRPPPPPGRPRRDPYLIPATPDDDYHREATRETFTVFGIVAAISVLILAGVVAFMYIASRPGPGRGATLSARHAAEQRQQQIDRALAEEADYIRAAGQRMPDEQAP